MYVRFSVDSTSNLYTIADLKAAFDAYVAEKNLVNAQERQFVNVGEDAALAHAVARKNEEVEFMRREEVLARLREHMQSWYEIQVEGKDAVRKCAFCDCVLIVHSAHITLTGRGSSSRSRSP